MFLLKPKWMIPIAIITGLFATFGVHRYLQRQKQIVVHPQAEVAKVVVATVNLPMGSKLEAEMLRLTDWPRDLVSGQTFGVIDSVVGRVVKTDIYPGEAILESKLAPRGSAGGFLGLIPPGMRAMTVAVNVVSGVSGFILPHTHVDVLATVTPSSKKEEATTRIILEDIEVLAVDQTFRKSDDEAVTVQSVTLLVLPEQAEKLALASNEGKLQLTLRNMVDRATASSSGIRLQQLISSNRPAAVASAPAPQAPAPAAPDTPEADVEEPPQVIEMLRSNVRSEVVLQGGKTKEAKPK
ncbi:MAG TPA: Flp pilus assembly protein CpaB [bacterium]|nr:Flp pilus assembly protein CpaB [bacterium]HPN34935.1 Flp pilus assembly protein CpaB [bacterium]